MNNPRVLAFAVTLAVLTPETLAFAEQASPPSKAAQAEAGSRFRKGAELFDEGDYQAALIEFRRAYEIAPNFAVLYNIGQVYYLLQDYANALNTFTRYLAEGEKSITAVRRRDVQKEIQKLQSRVANLDITVNVPDADVAIDDVAVGKSPLARPVVVNPGRHRIAISKAGFNTTSKSVEVASADAPKLAFELTEQTRAAPTPPNPEPPRENGAASGSPAQAVPPLPPPPNPTQETTPPPPPKSSYVWIGWTATGALAAGAAACGVLALNASNDLKTLRASPEATRQSLDGASGKAKTLALVSDILTGSAIVAGGVSLVFTIRGASDSSSKAPPASPSPTRGAALPSLKVGVSLSGVQVLGAF